MKRKLLLAAAAVCVSFAANAQILYDNGPVINRVGTGAGGADESVLYTTTFGMSTIGFGHQSNLFNRVADDFVNPNCLWVIDSIVFFGYQTGSTTTSTFTGVNFRIWDSIPDAVGSNVVYGDTTTNRMTRSVWAGAYRITETTTGNSTRPIMRNVCATPGLTLQAGTFWIDWASLGSLASGPWAPPRTPANVAVTGDGRQRIGNTWNPAVDGGTGTPAQGFPFIIYGTIVQPSADAGVPASICFGDSTMIGGSPAGSGGTGPLTYLWSEGLTVSDSVLANPYAMPAVTNNYMLTVTDALGCVAIDSVEITVLQPTTSSAAPVVCDSYLSPAGNTYTATGMYSDTLVNSFGCDSIITTNLTVNYSSNATLNPVTCDSYMSPAGNTYTSTGTYSETIPNAAGCDSMITINLTVNAPTTSTINTNACFSYVAPSGMTYTSSGTYMDTIANAAGCDSVITINVTIDTVNVQVTMSGVQLTAVASPATYQWVYCDSGYIAVAGETGQTFFPLQDGNYAVIVTEGSCTDTSACTMVIGTGIGSSATVNVALFPNPTEGSVTLSFGSVKNEVNVIVTDVNGRTVYTASANGVSRMDIDPALEAGLYFVTIYADGASTVKQLIRN